MSRGTVFNDDSTETDSYSSDNIVHFRNITLTTNNQQVQQCSVEDWLSARQLLQCLNEESLTSCYSDILTSLNIHNKIDIISALIKTSTPVQVTKAMEILNSTHSKQIENNDSKIITQNRTNNALFDNLSTDSILYIFNFLEKPGIKSFKLTSISNALVALKIMKFHIMHVFNMNEFFQNDLIVGRFGNVLLNTKQNRIQPFTKYSSIIDKFSNQYNISNLLLLQRRIRKNRYYIPTDLASQIKHNSVLLVFDQTKTSFMNESSLNLPVRRIILLQYRDSEKIKPQTIQFLLSTQRCPRMSDIKQYILHNLSKLLCVYQPGSNVWPSDWMKMEKYFRETSKDDKYKSSFINLYSQTYDDGYTLINTDKINTLGDTIYESTLSVLFELNHDHEYFLSVEKIVKITNENITQVIQYHNLDEHGVHFDLQTSGTTSYLSIKNIISSKLNIQSNNIEIYDHNGYFINEEDHIGFRNQIGWKIVTYDTSLLSEYKKYKVEIFEMDEKEQTFEGFVEYKQEVNELLNGTCGFTFVPTSLSKKIKMRKHTQRKYPCFNKTFWYQSISVHPKFENRSIEELRYQDLIVNASTIREALITPVISTLSHSMYGSAFKSIVDKYNDNDKWYFRINKCDLCMLQLFIQPKNQITNIH